MVTRSGLMIVLVIAAACAHADSPTETPEPTQHEFVATNFKTESGAVLPEAHLVYGTSLGAPGRRRRHCSRRSISEHSHRRISSRPSMID